jgi:SAM-dependent methyltransferase
MGVWRDRALPRLTDALMRGEDMGRLRALACAALQGEVLEIGFGSGLNIPFYPPEVTLVHAVEPAGVSWELSRRRRDAVRVPIEHGGLDGQRLDAADASYDAVLSTFTLCSIPDVAQALSEVRRVLRPGGSLHFLEHGLAPDPGVATWQRRLEPAQRRIAGGCHLTRDIPSILAGAGLEVTGLAEEYLPGPRSSRPWTYTYRGRAAT